MVKFLKKYHKWIGIIITLFLLLFAVSGIVLNHRPLFSSVNVSRSYLPSAYSFRNWNLGAVKKVEDWDNDTCVLYGNTGIWLSNKALTQFSDFSQGLPKGIDHKKAVKVYKTKKGKLFVATLFGLYRYEPTIAQWKAVPLPLQHPRIVDITEKGDTLLVLSRSFVLASTDHRHFTKHQLSKPPNAKDKVSLFKVLWIIHSGEIFGLTGKLVADAIALIFIFLTITGLILFINTYVIKRRKKQQQSITKLKKSSRWNLDWHNKIGWTTVVLLIITTITGMFLRPPLLIAIASASTNKIPYTTLDNDNYWFDRLRTLRYNPHTKTYILGTNRGMYYSKDVFNSPFLPFEKQVPVSVMGITVFEQKTAYEYLVGSFEGLFLWNIQTGTVLDYITKKTYVPPKHTGPPVGKFLVSGYMNNYQGKECFFDYRKGLCDINGTPLNTEMPTIIRHQPMSLWNLMLEVHTGRIFQDVLGMFYILIVPLIGLLSLFVLISGLVVWYTRHRKRKKR